MTNVQRTVEECIDAIFSDYSVHPSGVITARKKGYKVQIMPRREDGKLWGWNYSFIDPKGNVSVASNDVQHARIMVHRIQNWAWTL